MSWGDANLVATEEHDGVGMGVVPEPVRRVIEHAFGHVVQGEPAGVDGGLVGRIGVEGDEFDAFARLTGCVLFSMRGSVVVRILVVARAVVDIAMRVASVPNGGDVARDHLLKRAALLGRSSRKHVYAREPRFECTHCGDRCYRHALKTLQGAGRRFLAVFRFPAHHGLFALILEGDL